MKRTFYTLKDGRKFVTYCNGDGDYIRLFRRKTDANFERYCFERVVKVTIEEVCNA